MTYEDYLIKFEPIMMNICKKYDWLNMEYEDRLQECYLILFTKMDKLEEKETFEQKKAYLIKTLEGHLSHINVNEHRQLLNITYSHTHESNERDDELINIVQKDDTDYVVNDELLERIKKYQRKYYQENKELWQRYYQEHKENIKEYSRNYYQEHKEYYKLYNKLYYKKNGNKYYQQHKEVIKEKNKKQRKKYYEQHKEEEKTKRKIYYEQHKDEINRKKREKRRLEKYKKQGE